MERDMNGLDVNTYVIQGKRFRSIQHDKMFWVSIFDLAENFAVSIRRECDKVKHKSFYVYTNGMAKWMGFVSINSLPEIASKFSLGAYNPANEMARSAIRNIGAHILANKPDFVESAPAAKVDDEKIRNAEKLLQELAESARPAFETNKTSAEIDLSGFLFNKSTSQVRNRDGMVSITVNKNDNKRINVSISASVYEKAGKPERAAIGFNPATNQIVFMQSADGYKLVSSKGDPLHRYIQVRTNIFDATKFEMPFVGRPDAVKPGLILLTLKPLV